MQAKVDEATFTVVMATIKDTICVQNLKKSVPEVQGTESGDTCMFALPVLCTRYLTKHWPRGLDSFGVSESQRKNYAK
jgi:hypothetical protein